MKFRRYNELVARLANYILVIAEKEHITSWDAYYKFFDELRENVKQKLYKEPNKNERQQTE
jgi:hypothetical protein